MTINRVDGADGLSAYEVAVAGGFIGTEAEWVASLVGPQGPAGEDQLSADQITAVVLLAVCGPPLPRSADRLSDRQAAAIQLKAEGRSNTAIGRALKVSHVAVGKWFAKKLVRDCLQRYIATDGKKMYPEPIYPNREAKRAAKLNDQRVKAFKDWLLVNLVDMGTLNAPERFRANLDAVLDETGAFWADYFTRYEPELSEGEIAHFFRKE